MDTTEIESKWASEGYAVERKTIPPHHSAQPHSHPSLKQLKIGLLPQVLDVSFDQGWQ
jgi:hypothetical protein